MHEPALHFRFPADLEHIDPAVCRVQEWMQKQGLERHLFRFTLLIREALNNAVVHGAKCDPARQISFSVFRREEDIILSIKDTGPGFDPERFPEYPETERVCPEHGWGVPLMRKFASRFSYDQKDGTTVLVYALKDGADGEE
jgi:serine/threonine-protein kinase RsbW